MNDNPNRKEEAKPAPAAGAPKPAPAGKPQVRRRPGGPVTFGRVYITCSFNNTIITITDEDRKSVV